MIKRIKKGFTLTELIVVIAIIAILAAVLIPTSISFINKAKKSNDGQLAAQMTKEISWYCLENDVDQDDLLGTDIRTILLFRGYDLIPKTKNWTFWYNSTDKKVEVIENDESNISAAGFNTVNTTPKDPTNVYPDYYLLGKGSTELEKFINYVCNIDAGTIELYDRKDDNLNTNFQTFATYFNPTTTLYLSNSDGYTKATVNESIVRIIATEKTINLPVVSVDNLTNLLAPSINYLPKIIKTHEIDCNLTNIFTNLKSVEEQSIIEIKLPSFSEYAGQGYFYKYTMGELFDENGKQEIKDIIIGTDLNETGKQITLRKFIVSYYNEKGLYARGSTSYSIYE